MASRIPEEHFLGKVSQRAVIETKGKFLLTRDTGAAKWGVPGGRLHTDEEPLAGLVREVKEEMGVDIKPGSVVYTEAEIYSDGTPVFVVYYRATLKNAGQPLVLDPTEVFEAGWYGEDELLIMPLYESTKKAIQLANEK